MPPTAPASGSSAPRDLAVVVGARGGAESLASCLGALQRELEGHTARVVVAYAADDELAERALSRSGDVEAVRCPPTLLVPELWGRGLQRAEADVVVLLSAACVPAPGWLACLLGALREHPEAAGVGGPIDGPDPGLGGGSGSDWGAYFTRYSAYMPPVAAGRVEEIPGDNALYRRPALDRAWTEREEGFWETLVHRRLRAEGAALMMAPEAVVRLGPVADRRAFARDRFRHGRHFGATREVSGRGERVLRALAAPMLPILFVARILRRVLRRNPDRLIPLARSLPWLLLYSVAWSFGEASGYLRRRSEPIP